MKYIISIVIIFITLSCSLNNEKILNQRVYLKNETRTLINSLNTPTVSLKLLKDGEIYSTLSNVQLTEDLGGYYIDLDLLSGGKYTFSEFSLYSDGKLAYILDVDAVANSEGFTLSLDGVLSVTPKVYLKKVTGIVYSNLEYQTLSVDIQLDESSVMEPVNLTFQVSSNIPDATFHIYKYTIYWVSGPILEQNQTFDMDTGDIYDPLEEGDDDPWGSDKFKIVTTDSQGNEVFVVGFAAEWSKKHIHLTL